MKKIHSQLLAAFLLLSLLFVASCGDDKEKEKQETPTISLDATSTPTNVEQALGAPIVMNIQANSGPDGRELEKFLVAFSADGSPFTEVAGSVVENINNRLFTRVVNGAIPNAAGTKTVSWRMTIEDKAKKQASVTATYRVKAAPTDTTKDTTKIVAPRKIDSQTFTEGARFMSTSRGAIYGASEGQTNAATVDIAFFHSDVSGLNLVQPLALKNSTVFLTNAISWGTVPTMFKTTNLTPAQFLAITDQKVLKGFYDNGTLTEVTGDNASGTRATSIAAANKGGQIQTGRIFAFYNNMKYGLIHISNADAAGKTMRVDVRVEN
jgi:hypothetical protein